MLNSANTEIAATIEQLRARRVELKTTHVKASGAPPLIRWCILATILMSAQRKPAFMMIAGSLASRHTPLRRDD